MKTFFGLIFLLVVVAIFLILGNMLRCASVSEQTNCPRLCNVAGTEKKVTADGVSPEGEFVRCQAPVVREYWQYFGDWVNNLRYKK